MHINYWNTKYEKKNKNKTPPLLVLSQTTFPFIPYVLQSGRTRLCALVAACIWRCQKAESAMQMSPINTSLTALICIYAAFKITHLTCTNCTPPCVCVVHLSVLWSCGALERCADSVTVVFGALRDTCLPGVQHNNKKKKNKPSEHGRLVSTRLRSVSQQWDFLSYCLLVYSYRLMSPLLPLSWVENTTAAMEISWRCCEAPVVVFFHPFICIKCVLNLCSVHVKVKFITLF